MSVLSDDDAESLIIETPKQTTNYRFQWDRRGPASVAGTTEHGGGDYFSAQPRLSLLPNASSLTLSIPSEWSSAKHGFHAISTVLNNPHKKQAPPKAHSHLPAVVPADLPRVRRKDFDSYLKGVQGEWDRFVKADTTTSGSHFYEDDEPRIGSSIPPLSTVPQVFFDTSFDLSNPKIFALVTGSDSMHSDPTSLSHSLPLLDTLSHHSDVIEQHLTHEITLRSPSFFSALSNLHSLHSSSSSALDQLTSLRASLTKLDEEGAKKGMELVRKEMASDALEGVREGVKVVERAREGLKVGRSLVQAGQWAEAVSVLEELWVMWEDSEEEEEVAPPTNTLHGIAEEEEEEKPSTAPSLPLCKLSAYASLPTHLLQLTSEIAASLSSEVVAVLRADLIEPNRSNEALRDRLRPLLLGLVRTNGVKEGMLSWREVVLAEVRACVQGKVAIGDLDAEEEKPTGKKSLDLTGSTSTMPHAEFMHLLTGIYTSLLTLVEAVKEQTLVVDEIIQDSLSSGKHHLRADPNPLQTLDAFQSDLGDLLTATCDLANTLPARLITLRTSSPLLPSSLVDLSPAEQKAKTKSPHLNPLTDISLASFIGFYTHSWNYLLATESIARRMIVPLRSVVVGTAKGYLQAFHQERLGRSAKVVEDEMWVPCEVEVGLQRGVVDVIVESAVKDSEGLVVKVGGDGDAPQTNGNGNSKDGATTTTTTSKHLTIESHTYFLVSCTSAVLFLLLDYLRLVVSIKSLGTELMSRVVEFLKAFNSRVCQVVLGAGAMRSAGLRNITAKHLALASQSLSVMFELIPYVRETFRRHLSPKQAVMLVEFDKLKRDYQEHQNEIHAKLVAIMGDRLMTHIKSLQAVDWTTPRSDRAVNDYMEILVKETVTLHKVLSRYLSMQVVEYVMTQVFAAINHGLSEEYNKIELPSQEAKMRLLADAKYLHAKLSTLKNVGTISSMLITVVSEKPIPRPPGALPSPGPASPPPSTPQRSSTLMSTTNERLKGLLSGRSPTFDKALPSPMRRSSFSPAPQSQQEQSSPRNSMNGNAPTPPPKPATPSATGGGFFMQVDASASGFNTPSSIARTGSPEPSEASTDLAVSRQSLSPAPPPPLPGGASLDDLPAQTQAPPPPDATAGQ